MAKKIEDLSALRAKVQTYEAELERTTKELGELLEERKKASKERPPTHRDMADVLDAMASYIHFMEKHGAALRSLVVGQEKHIKALERKVPKYDAHLER